MIKVRKSCNHHISDIILKLLKDKQGIIIKDDLIHDFFISFIKSINVCKACFDKILYLRDLDLDLEMSVHFLKTEMGNIATQCLKYV